MSSSKMTRVTLIVAGLIATVVGISILLVPAAFHATNGIVLGDNASLLSEIRAPGAALLASGVLVVCGAFVEKLTFSALLLATVLYLAYGVSRIISIALDGMPANGLVAVAVLELAVGLVCARALLMYGKSKFTN